MSSAVNDEARPDAGEPVDDLAEQLDDPRPAPPAPGKETGATASERASARTAAELSDR